MRYLIALVSTAVDGVSTLALALQNGSKPEFTCSLVGDFEASDPPSVSEVVRTHAPTHPVHSGRVRLLVVPLAEAEATPSYYVGLGVVCGVAAMHGIPGGSPHTMIERKVVSAVREHIRG